MGVNLWEKKQSEFPLFPIGSQVFNGVTKVRIIVLSKLRIEDKEVLDFVRA